MSCKMIGSAKEVAESCNFTSIPSNYVFSQDEDAHLPDTDAPEIPTIDFSLLINGTPDQRSQTIRRLGQASMEWGFFMVIYYNKIFLVSFSLLNLLPCLFTQPE